MKKEKDAQREDETEEFRVEDRRHWQTEDEDSETDAAEPTLPSYVDAFRERAEAAEQKLQEYIEAFKSHQKEQDQVRARLARDVDRRVELKFGELVAELLTTVDDLDLSLTHVADVEAARPLAEGVALARDRFLKILEAHGISRICPEGEPFDPNHAEALRVDPVAERKQDGHVTETLRPGYRLGERIVRPAQVAVGRFQEST